MEEAAKDSALDCLPSSSIAPKHDRLENVATSLAQGSRGLGAFSS
jgi:hypothetical protein